MVSVQIIRSGNGTLQRPFTLCTPVASHVNAALRRFVSVPAAHHKDPHRTFFIFVSAVRDALKPAVHPCQFQLLDVEFGLRAEFGFSGEAAAEAVMNPRSHCQTLRALLASRQT